MAEMRRGWDLQKWLCSEKVSTVAWASLPPLPTSSPVLSKPPRLRNRQWVGLGKEVRWTVQTIQVDLGAGEGPRGLLLSRQGLLCGCCGRGTPRLPPL